MIKTKYPKVSGATDYKQFGYVVVKPDSMPSGTVPIILIGHGQGEIGDGTSTQLDRVSNWGGFTALQRSVDDFKIVFIHLQTSSRYQYGEIQAGLAFAKTFSYCDVNNIHYYGVSLGGYGFFQQSAASITFPTNFATILLAAPGPGNTDLTGDNIGKSGRPIWILHGHNDCVVDDANSQSVISDINAHGGTGHTWISIWKDRTSCSGCCSPTRGTCTTTSVCPTCSQTTTTSNSCGSCTSSCQAAHNMVSILVGESWNISTSISPNFVSAYNSLPTYAINTGRGLKEISSGTLAKMGYHQWVKSNKKGSAIVAPTSTYSGGTTPPPNAPPVANAGTDKAITLPTNSVTLSAIGSTDTTGTISSYQWSKISGPTSYSIQSANTVSTVVSNLVEGTYVFRVNVTDNGGLSDTDDVTVTVNPDPTPPPPPPNGAPIARAGSDQTITLPTSYVTVDGTGSTDADGTISTYLWTKISGGAATIVSATSAVTDITGLTEGNYVFQLKVTDNLGASGYDQMNVTVNPAPIVKTVLVTFRVYSDGTTEKI